MAESAEISTDSLLIVAIINFLEEERNRTDISDDTKESLEVTIQCLQTAYDLKPEDIEPLRKDAPSLRELYGDRDRMIAINELVESIREDAEKQKNDGNDLMKAGKNAEAVDAYTSAICIAGNNPVYYCNRAAAYSRLGNYSAAIKDCQEAISLDPKHGKAYGRMGFAYSSYGDNVKAIECYKKAIELDPTNESYHTNLKLAEENISKEGNSESGVRQVPNVGNIMPSLMSAPGSSESGNVGGGMESLFNVGLQLFQQIQTSNPELIEQLQRQLSAQIQRPQNDNADPEAPN